MILQCRPVSAAVKKDVRSERKWARLVGHEMVA
jgi:hypothetical protein